MVLYLGNFPCRYKDCCHYLEDCTTTDYKEHKYCGRCKNAYFNQPKGFWERLFERKPKECINRFDNLHQPIG